MTLAIVGPGSVGLWLAARLARGAETVTVISRRIAAARCLRRDGIQAEDLATGERWEARVAAWSTDETPPEPFTPQTLVFCTRSEDTEDAARRIAGWRGQEISVVASLQNGVENETVLARYFPRVLGGVFRQTVTRSGENRVRGAGRGRVVVGRFPEGIDDPARALAERLRGAGFEVSLSPDIAADKWLKLCVNLMSTPNALIRRADHRTPAFVELKVRLLEEAKAVLATAGIRAAPADGRDRTLDEEIAFQRRALEEGRSARDLPLYNHVWTALRTGAPLEADRFHERILDLARREGLEAPVNAHVLTRLREAARTGRGPECYGAGELLPGDG